MCLGRREKRLLGISNREQLKIQASHSDDAGDSKFSSLQLPICGLAPVTGIYLVCGCIEQK